ncbi:MAG: hypothetical protein JXQ87_06545 [Bacteroidia bacterium]
MEDEEIMNVLLEKLYQERFNSGISSVRNALAEMEIFLRNNQLNRIMADVKSNGFAMISKEEDDYQAQITPEGTMYCEDILMIR